MSAAEDLRTLRNKQTIIKDRIRGVASGMTNGVYIFGGPGTSKTYLVTTTLKELGVPFVYANGHLTTGGLFEKMANNTKSVLVLDDVGDIVCRDTARPLLLAGLGTPPDGSRARRVGHQTAHGDRTVMYEGGLIMISNLTLAAHGDMVLAAFRDRINVLGYEPTDGEMEAYIRDVASKGPRGVSAEDAMVVAEYMFSECRRLGIRPSMRTLLDKGLSDFKLSQTANVESDWRDLLRSELEQATVTHQHPIRKLPRKTAKEVEQQFVLNLCNTVLDPMERLNAWRERFGKEKSSLHRRIAELRDRGLLATGQEMTA